jgi:hypothetical protein
MELAYDRIRAFQPEPFTFAGGRVFYRREDGSMFGLSGDVLMGILFGGLLLLIGAVGTFHSAKNAKGPRERAFATQTNLFAWMAVFLFFMVIYFLPEPYNYLIVVLYFAAFPFIVYRVCSRRLKIRRLEAMHATGHKV